MYRSFRPQFSVKLLIELKDPDLGRFLVLSDVIKLVDELNSWQYYNNDIKKLNLKNQDRKFIAQLIDRLIADGKCDLKNCWEKKKLWAGLLHHIHYRPKTPEAKAFTDAMRGDENHSVYSAFEKALDKGDIPGAVEIIIKEKGQGAFLRNINFIISRCRDRDQVDYVIDQIHTDNTIILMQLLLEYGNMEKYMKAPGRRSFAFSRFGMVRSHNETAEEAARRKSFIGRYAILLERKIREELKTKLAGRLGKVYIDPAMKNYALPLAESTSQGGYGVLARGSRIHIGDAKKIRAFTYWEKVNDIDLSLFGVDSDGKRKEFSWRTMADNQSSAISYSGDQTSGYKGGSEFFDIDVPELLKLYPNMRYLICCDNVYSGSGFNNCICRAGYMIRDREDSGEVFEPKTVKSSFTINCDSNFAYLFGTTSNTTVILSSSTSYFNRIMKIRDWNMQAGLQYSLPLRQGRDMLTLGAVYQPKKSFHGETWGTSYDSQDNKVDTIGFTDMAGNYEQPASIGVGLSYNVNRKLTLEADYTYQKWSDA